MTDLARRSAEPGSPLAPPAAGKPARRNVEADLAVAVEGLTKVFPIPFRKKSITAVRDLNLQVEAGEVYGLLGPNGSGKSTTLKIILGLVSPTRGRTQIFGRDSSEVATHQSVGFLPENPYFYKFLTGAETLRFFGKLCGLHGADLTDQVQGLLDLVGLTEARNQRLSTYSKGMLQRIGLAQALINEPALIVLDEPTAGVDPAGSRDIRNLILDLKKRGVTVLLSSHLLEQVQEVCDRVGIISKGELVREGPLDELISVEDRTEIVLENASGKLLKEIEKLATKSKAKVIERRTATTTLERLFLDATKERKMTKPE
jgi:ABC-2 type transport system ATP-binding protein